MNEEGILVAGCWVFRIFYDCKQKCEFSDNTLSDLQGSLTNKHKNCFCSYKGKMPSFCIHSVSLDETIIVSFVARETNTVSTSKETGYSERISSGRFNKWYWMKTSIQKWNRLLPLEYFPLYCFFVEEK